ncbi:DUSAM domain-containing protein [Archangium gephyra]|uniref:DUSAM domain-containing protein n=1 Tax=Archangium gephyra TaxID=48 RepID=UPI003B7D2A91
MNLWKLTADVRELLRRTAPTVAISNAEAERALSHTGSAIELLQQIRRRADDGTRRLMQALDAMYRLLKKGDIGGARQQMQDVLAVEVVPHLRELAESELEKLDEPS